MNKVTACLRQIDHHKSGLLVNFPIVHARIDFPVHVFSAFRLRSNQDNRYRGVSQVLVPNYLTDVLVAEIVGNVVCIDRPVNEYPVLFSPCYQGVLVGLVAVVGIADK